MNLLYLHGFNSTGNSHKIDYLKTKIKFDHVEQPTFDYSNIDNVLVQIDDIVNQLDDIIVIGMSFGGFVARYVGMKYDLKSVLINPVIDYKDMYKHVGPQINHDTQEKWELKKSDVDNYKQLQTDYNKPALMGNLVIVGEKDEIVDPHRVVYAYKNIAHVVTFENELHRFKDVQTLVPYIEEYINAIWM